MPSVRKSASLKPFMRGWLAGFLMWLGLCVAMMFFETGVIGAFALLFALAMSFVLQLIWLLAPRNVVLGPHGVFIRKAESSLLIPWSAIARFQIFAIELPAEILLVEHSGAEHRVLLAENMAVGSVDALLREKLRESRGATQDGMVSRERADS